MNPGGAPDLKSPEPFPGPRYFEAHDAEFFFGRDEDVERLLPIVLSSQATLLHARSGAGKTSLLNVLVSPRLEAHGVRPVRVRLWDDPPLSTSEAVMRSGIPHPQLEVSRIEHACHYLSVPGSASLETLLAAFDREDTESKRDRASLLRPEALSIEAYLPGKTNKTASGHYRADLALTLPYFSSLLRKSLTPEQYVESLAPVLPGGAENWIVNESDIWELPINELVNCLRSRKVSEAYEVLLTELSASEFRLAAFFKTFYRLMRECSTHVPLVLIFDQFEEIFTNFVDRRQETVANDDQVKPWKKRWDFIDQLHELWNLASAVREVGDPEVAVRFLFSMRSDYIAEMGPIREFCTDLDRCSYLLGRLRVPDGAITAIRRPIIKMESNIEDGCVNRIVKELTREQRFVEPAELQIVCQRLWREYISAPVESGTIVSKQLADLGGTSGIRDAYIDEYLAGQEKRIRYPLARLETLAILRGLVTRDGTRNIKMFNELVDEPFRPIFRKELLEDLAAYGIIRFESRTGNRFVEIAHEFLIESALRCIGDEFEGNQPGARRERAIDILQNVAQMPNDTPSRSSFEAVNVCREQVRLSSKVMEVLVRGALFWGNRDSIKWWLDHYVVADTVTLSGALESLQIAAQRSDARPLLRDEWRLLAESHDSISVDEQGAKAMFIATLHWAGADDRALLRDWIEEVNGS